MRDSKGTAAMKIERARLRDADELIKLEAKCFKMRYDRDFIYFWKPLILDAYVYKAVEDGKIVAGILAFATRSPRAVYVDSVFTSTAFRHRGAATKLLERVERDSGCQKIILDTMNQFREAVKLYEKLGFKKVKVLRDYYEDGTDRLLMVKEIGR